LVFIMFFTVSGGAYGLEDVIGSSGAGIGLLLIIITPLIWSIPTAYMVAELSTAMPVEGGYYYWVKKAMGPFWGFQEGWWSWLTTWVDMAIYPVLFVDYASYYFPSLATNGIQRWLLGAALIWFFTILNIRGAKLVGDSSTLFAVIVLAPFVLMTVIGLFHMNQSPIHPVTPNGQSIGSSLTLGLFVVMWNYYGWDGLSTVAGEMRNPRRDYPRTLLITVPLITAAYLLPTIVALAVVGTHKVVWEAGAWTQIAEMIGGKWLGVLLGAAALVSAAGLFSALLLSVSRIPFVMGEDGYLPKRLFTVHKKFGTPWVALVVSSAIYTIFILGPFQSLVVVDVIVYSAALMLEFAALIVFRRKYPNMKRPFKIPGGWPVLTLICLGPAFILGFAIYSQVVEEGFANAVGLSFLFLATGPVLYFVARHFKRKRGEPEHQVELELVDEAGQPS
ncbi:MAG TPA: APC family permease, partial [Actinomycetota bacterium]